MRLKQGALRGAAISVLGAALAGCVPMVVTRYAVDAPGTKPIMRRAACYAGEELTTGAAIEVSGARISYGAFESSKGLEVFAMIRLEPGAVARVRQSQLALSVPGLSAPLMLTANEVTHDELKARTICTRQQSKPFENPLKPPPPVCEREYGDRVTKSQPLDQDIVPPTPGPHVPRYLSYDVSYRFEGKVPEEFTLTTPVIEVNQAPVPPTVMRFRRHSEFVVALVNC